MENFGAPSPGQEQNDADPDTELPGDEEGARHYSTGRLTGPQADVIQRWRARLLEDRPLPGKEPVGPVLRLLGIDDRPKASCSDVIAAAIRDLAEGGGITGLDLARYSEAGRLALSRGAPGAAVHQPVSYYLPAPLVEVVEELRAAAVTEVVDAHRELWRQAAERHPDDEDEQAAWVREQIFRRRLPARARAVPRGVIARMAVDRWAALPVDDVAATAADYAQWAHQQPHRTRRDMRPLRR